ncbi:unnamed protein product [Symbiodinium sp. CCMP2592]|nr:unnamed protein product [Symbiodinium sp. CCMP2592]
MRVVDFDYFPSTEAAVWEDGETDRQCLAYAIKSDEAADALANHEVGIRVWEDADAETDEVICLRVVAVNNNTANIETRLLRVVILEPDNQGDSRTSLWCTQGVNCTLNLTGLHYTPGARVALAQDCSDLECERPSATTVSEQSYVHVITAAESLLVQPGKWFLCRCFAFDMVKHDADEGENSTVTHYETQAIQMLFYEGPSDSNLAYCTLGWPNCSVSLPFSTGTPDVETSLRILAACPLPGQTVEGTDAPSVQALIWGGVANQTETGPYPMADVQALYDAGAGLYGLCWCKSVPGRPCVDLEDYIVPAGLFVLVGPYPQELTQIYMGDTLQVAIAGTGLSANDRLEIKPSCGSPKSFLVTETTDGYNFDFGVVQEQSIPPGQYNFCWCREYSTEMACNLPDHWRLVGDITVICTGDSYNNGGVCNQCGLPWNGPNEDKTGCVMYADRALAIIFMNLFLTLAFFLLSLQLELTHPDRARPAETPGAHWFEGKTGWRVSGRRVLIEDISVEGEGDHLVVTTLGSHFLRVGTTFRVHFTQTNHYLLDGQYKRATVVDGSRLDLHNLDGTFFAADASGGFFVLSIPCTFWYAQAYACVPLLLFCTTLIVAGTSMVTFAPPYPVAVTLVTAVQMAIALLFRGLWKSRRVQTPLRRRLQQYIAMIDSQNPRPQPCDRGASRAVTAFRLFELFEFFQAFIKFRTMYYIDPNLVRPITRKHKLSFAERVGPQQVQFFISHWWGTPFVRFCESVRRHAVQISGSEDESTWKLVSYWICTFSNNQYRIKEELGTYHKDSSFYLALHSGVCKGTAMIMDERASLLNRSWCLFELLQTVTLEKTQANFTGLYFCTPTGVLNNGDATVELAMNIGKRIAGLSLQSATATSQDDKDMINKLVLEEMGSFHRIDRILRGHLADALKKCQGMVDEQFDNLFTELQGNAPENELESMGESHGESPVPDESVVSMV